MPVTSLDATRVVMPVDKERFQNEKAYQMTMSVVRSMLIHGIITRDDYNRINEMMTEKYSPILGLTGAELS